MHTKSILFVLLFFLPKVVMAEWKVHHCDGYIVAPKELIHFLKTHISSSIEDAHFYLTHAPHYDLPINNEAHQVLSQLLEPVPAECPTYYHFFGETGDGPYTRGINYLFSNYPIELAEAENNSMVIAKIPHNFISKAHKYLQLQDYLKSVADDIRIYGYFFLIPFFALNDFLATRNTKFHLPISWVTARLIYNAAFKLKPF